MKKIEVTIKGISPLLMHRYPGLDLDTKKRTGKPDWKAEAEDALYKDPQGHLYQPASHIEGTLRTAATSFKIAGKRGASYARLVASTVDVTPEAIPHKIEKWETDARPVVIQRARVVRYRPKLPEWELDFTLTLNDDQLPTDVVKQILDQAGLYVGIGDYRPGSPRGGKFGKFMVTRFEVVKEEKQRSKRKLG